MKRSSEALAHTKPEAVAVEAKLKLKSRLPMQSCDVSIKSKPLGRRYVHGEAERPTIAFPLWVPTSKVAESRRLLGKMCLAFRFRVEAIDLESGSIGES